MTSELEQLAAALKTDPYFEKWRVCVGEDKANPIRETDAPFIVLNPGANPVDDRDDRDHDEIQINIDWGISCETVTLKKGIEILDGFSVLEAQKQEIRRIICAAFEVDWFSQFDFTIDSEQFPLFLGGLTFTANLNTTL